MRSMPSGSPARRQRGLILIVMLVLMGVLSLIVAAMVSSSNINFRLAGNHQYRLESRLVAHNALEAYISNPANFTLPLPAAAIDLSFDVTGDGTDDYVATVQPPVCLRSVPIKLTELSVNNPADVPCFGSGAVQNSGIIGSGGGSGNSWCARMMWDVEASVDDATTAANLTMHQGVALRALIGTPCPS